MSKFQIEFTVRAQVTQLRAADLRFTVTVAVQNIERLLKQQKHNSPSANTELLWGLVTAQGTLVVPTWNWLMKASTPGKK